jgi:hypothetical protein
MTQSPKNRHLWLILRFLTLIKTAPERTQIWEQYSTVLLLHGRAQLVTLDNTGADFEINQFSQAKSEHNPLQRSVINCSAITSNGTRVCLRWVFPLGVAKWPDRDEKGCGGVWGRRPEGLLCDELELPSFVLDDSNTDCLGLWIRAWI